MSKHKQNTVKLSKIMPVSKELHITRYTFDTWCKTQYAGDNVPESIMHSEWEERTLPGDVCGFAVNTLDYMVGSDSGDFESAVICPLDDEYLQYLANNHLKHSGQTAANYAAKMSKEKAFELMRKNGMDVQYTLAFLPVFLTYPDIRIVDETHFVLTDTCRVLLKKYLGKIVGRENVFVSRYLFTEKAIGENDLQILSFAVQYFESGKDIGLAQWETQNVREDYELWDFDDGEMDTIVPFGLFIPVVIRSTLSSAVIPFDLDELGFAVSPSRKYLLADDFTGTGIEMANVNDTRFYEKLAAVFGSITYRIPPVLFSLPEVFAFTDDTGYLVNPDEEYDWDDDEE